MAGRVVGTGEIVITADLSKYEAAMAGADATAQKTSKSIMAKFAEVGPTLAAVGASAAVMGAGVAKAAELMVGMTVRAAESSARLRELQLVVGDAAVASRALAAAVSATSLQTDLLATRAALSSDAVTEVSEAFLGAEAILGDTLAGFANLADSTTELRQNALGAIPVIGDLAVELDKLIGPGQGNVGLNPAINYALHLLAERGREAELELETARGAVERLIASMEKGGNVIADQHFDFIGMFQEDAQAQTRAMDAAQAHAQLVMDARIQAYRNVADAAERGAADEVKALDKVKKAQEALYDAQAAQEAAVRQIMDQRVQDHLEEQQRKIAEAQLWTSLAGTAIGSIESITATALSGYQQRIAAGEDLNRYEAKNANAALVAYEAVAIGQAGISSALVGINSFAALTAIQANPFTAAATSVALAAGSFAAAVAAIHEHRPFDYQYVEPAVTGHGSDPNYNADDVYGHGAGDVDDDPRADKPRDLPGSSRSRGRNRRAQRVEVILVEDRTSSGKLRR